MIENGTLFRAVDEAVTVHGVVVIQDRRIAAAGPADAVAVPPDARRLDARGGLIMPGVVDAHVHVEPNLGRGVDVLTPWLGAGVTTLVDCGTNVIWPDEDRRRAALVPQAPRLFLAGPFISARGGYPFLGRQFDRPTLQLTTPADARRAVRALISEGHADLIKVGVDSGFFSDYGAPGGWPCLRPQTLRALAGEAHALGRPIWAHVTQPGEMRAVLDAGFDAVAHVPIEEVPDELLREAARAGMILVTTAHIWSEPEHIAAVRSNIGRFVRLGGRVALGTDSGGDPPRERRPRRGPMMPVDELQELRLAGLTPAQVLIAATRTGAEAIWQGRELGTLEPGKRADLIVVDGDPLADVTALARVAVVVRDGEVVVPSVPRAPAPPL